ncbi:reverse transcriptase domain-containing protein [Desulfitobacterium sp. Sab5]|uniref:reverse transcriptase domain-containing protein n=1 Tax=Desulfitobacterium nosdiversum TaxID=3375356 RepID=UPI003CEAD0D8
MNCVCPQFPLYEQDFLDLSYGFRPGRSCHDALKTLNHKIEYGKTSYIVDADIRSFFTNVNLSPVISSLSGKGDKTRMSVR